MKTNNIANGTNFYGYKNHFAKKTLKSIIEKQCKSISQDLKKDSDYFECAKEEINSINWFLDKIHKNEIDIEFTTTGNNPMYVTSKKQQRQIPIYGMFNICDVEKFTRLKEILTSAFTL